MQRIENEVNLKNMSQLKPKKQLALFLVGFVGLVLIELVGSLLLQSIARSAIQSDYAYQTFIESPTAGMILNGSSYFILFVIFVILLKNDTSELFKSFKGWKPYVAAAIGFSAILTFNLLYNLILSATGVNVNDNVNESSLNSIVTVFPFASLLLFALIGPLCEELTYRVGLFSLCRRVNRVFAYVITIIVFTLIHIDFTSGDKIVNELLNIPFYAFSAFVFSYLYEKFGLASSLTVHVTNNLISILGAISTVFKQ